MKLLQHAWSDLLILDHLHQRLHNHLPDESPLPNGQKFNLLLLSLLGCPNLEEPLHDLTARLTEIRFDVPDYVCLKFLMLLNPGNGIISYFIFLFFFCCTTLQLVVFFGRPQSLLGVCEKKMSINSFWEFSEIF